jgi:hypothetical protein
MVRYNAIQAIKIGGALRKSAFQAREPHSFAQGHRDESPPMTCEAQILRLFK